MSDQEVNEEPANVPAPEEPKPEDKTPSPTGGQRSHDLLHPATEERYNFRFSAGNEFTDKFKRAAEVLNINSPHFHIEEVFNAALEALLEKKDPKRKQERRRKREAKKEKTPPGEEKPKENESASPTVSRYIPSEVRERVLDKAGHQCEYHGPDGVRCSSRTGIEVDHTLPFAVYQRNDEDSLRALCPAHNRFEAEEFYGREFIEAKIEARRREMLEGVRIQHSEPGASSWCPQGVKTKRFEVVTAGG